MRLLNGFPRHSFICLFVAACSVVISGCGNGTIPPPAVFPKNFKVEVPFLLTGRGIIINTYWGAARKHHVLCVDNYSPSWIKKPMIQYDRSFTQARDQGFKTSTADGTTIQGEIGICDTLRFEGVTFVKAPFYVMPANAKDNANDDGVLGSELMAKGIWKIDFKSNMLTFTSAIDSLEEVPTAEILPAKFTDESITVEVQFGNGLVKTMGIDLGYNGDFLLPTDEFNGIRGAKKTFSEAKKFSTPASSNIVNTTSVLDTVKISHSWFLAFVATNETVRERLLGLQFLRRFDYVIFDFINRRMYVPRKIW